MSSACVPVSAPTPWIIPTPNAVRRPVRAHLQRRDVLVPVEPRLEPAPAVADAVEHEHPAAAHPELGPVAEVLPQRHEHPDPQDQQREADDAAHDRVDPVGQHRAEREGQQPEAEHDERVPQRVQRAELDRLLLLGDEPRPADRHRRERRHRRDGRHAARRVGGRGRRLGRRVRTAVRVRMRVRLLGDVSGRDRGRDGRARVLRPLAGAAVRMAMLVRMELVVRVVDLRPGVGRRGRRRDVGDRGDVVPVEAVPEARAAGR